MVSRMGRTKGLEKGGRLPTAVVASESYTMLGQCMVQRPCGWTILCVEIRGGVGVACVCFLFPECFQLKKFLTYTISVHGVAQPATRATRNRANECHVTVMAHAPHSTPHAVGTRSHGGDASGQRRRTDRTRPGDATFIADAIVPSLSFLACRRGSARGCS